MMREFSRRRVNVFFSALVIPVFLAILIQERADWTDVVDDGGILALAIIAIVIIALRRRKNSKEELRSTNKSVLVLSIMMVGFTLFGLYNEIADPAAFGDDPAQLIIVYRETEGEVSNFQNSVVVGVSAQVTGEDC